VPEYDRTIMAMRGRIGAHVTASRHDSRELTANARAAFKSKFEDEVDPDGLLAPAERARRADQLRRAHYARLAYLSAVSRRKARGCRPASGGARRPSSPNGGVPKDAPFPLTPTSGPDASTDTGDGGRS